MRDITPIYKVYAICDYTNGDIRYIGCTKKKLKERLTAHIFGLHNMLGRKKTWINEYLERGEMPVILELFSFEDKQTALNKEQECIKFYRKLGYDLLNMQ